MLLVSREFVKPLKEGTQDVKELAEWLMKNSNIYDLAMAHAELVCQVEAYNPKKIVVTQEELNNILSLFRVRGIAEDGTPIRSGRKKKE